MSDTTEEVEIEVVAYCAYCKTQFAAPDEATIATHALSCRLHPLRACKKRLRKLATLVLRYDTSPPGTDERRAAHKALLALARLILNGEDE